MWYDALRTEARVGDASEQLGGQPMSLLIQLVGLLRAVVELVRVLIEAFGCRGRPGKHSSRPRHLGSHGGPTRKNKESR